MKLPYFWQVQGRHWQDTGEKNTIVIFENIITIQVFAQTFFSEFVMTFPTVENATKFKSGQSETYDGDAVGGVWARARHFVSDQSL